ncbi:MAG: hypothetical protein V7K74_31080 [Nostoc sp.]
MKQRYFRKGDRTINLCYGLAMLTTGYAHAMSQIVIRIAFWNALHF